MITTSICPPYLHLLNKVDLTVQQCKTNECPLLMMHQHWILIPFQVCRLVQLLRWSILLAEGLSWVQCLSPDWGNSSLAHPNPHSKSLHHVSVLCEIMLDNRFIHLADSAKAISQRDNSVCNIQCMFFLTTILESRKAEKIKIKEIYIFFL